MVQMYLHFVLRLGYHVSISRIGTEKREVMNVVLRDIAMRERPEHPLARSVTNFTPAV